ncbi:MAG: MBL fold metallo-hydrolase [Thermoprotei archaeon]|nr:MAG: MBL fold metallo-hydrolase [Thermoprotei archaeon]
MSVEWTKIVVVLDNEAYTIGLESEWGLSIYLETPHTKVLFDTDTDPVKLMFNLRSLNINLLQLDSIVISHTHRDHTGGLRIVADYNPDLRVYMPKRAKINRKIRDLKLSFIHLEETTSISKGVYVVGEQCSTALGIWEQAVAVRVRDKLILLCGCSHPGVDRIAEKALRDIGGRLHIVIGGFHNPPYTALNRLIELGVNKIYPLHCSGSSTRAYIEENYPERIGRGGSGLILEV